MSSTTVYVWTKGKPGAWARWVFPFVIEPATFQLLGKDLYFRQGDTINKFVPGLMSDQLTVGGDVIEFGGIVRWNYLDLGTPGASKHLYGFDFVGEGVPSFSVGYDERFVDRLSTAYAIDPDTLPGGIIPYDVVAPAMSPMLEFAAGEAWKVKSLILYVNEMGNGP
jgi:hypothetical protein